MEYEWKSVYVVVLFMTLMILILGYAVITGDDTYLMKVPSAGHLKTEFDKDSSELCTFALLRKAYRRRGYFPAGGEWLQTREGVPYFQPTLCRYRYPRMKNEFTRKCLSKANISYVITTGDSTGGLYNGALLQTSTLHCPRSLMEELKENGFLPDKEYFTREMPEKVAKFVTAKFRFCSGCASRLHRCGFDYKNNSYSLEVEHLAQTMILDDSLQLTYPSYKDAAISLNKVWSITSQEFVFRYYLKDKHPDVFLIFLPFAHAKHNIHLSRLPMEIEYFKKLVEEYLPNTTKLFYFPSYGEFEQARNGSNWSNHLFEGMLAREKIDKMNRVLYKVLEEDLLKPGGRYFGFFDLIDVSQDRGNWSTDSVHMKAEWYESVMAMFWETYCNSVLLDMF